MVVSFAPAFLRQIKKLDPPVKTAVRSVVEKFIDFYESGRRTPGLAVKRLRGEVWEARSGLRTRIVYRLFGGELRFILAGDHAEVRRSLADC
ncbi:MAG: hypothetical protein KGJ84_09170 [Elusimicrobia bacterium]|nr:hypothetical protein [Elusimicrobiota bacterium]